MAATAIFAASLASAATVTVTETGDTIAVDGTVTLREAIASINNGANVNSDVLAVGVYGTNDSIFFAIPGPGIHTIMPASALPTINRPVMIDGYTQPGSSANTLVAGDNAVILIELDGSLAGSSNGLTIAAGNSSVKGLVIGNFAGGIELVTGAGNVVSGNFLGTDTTGVTARGNHIGVIVESANNIIGGSTPAMRNVVSGNQVGVGVSHAGASGNVVLGNFIGTDASGTAAIPNSRGINIAGGTTNTTVGGTTPGARNLISGNTGDSGGIIVGGVIFDMNSGVTIQGNYIGVDVTGRAALGNCDNGILILGLQTGIQIGGTSPGEGNVISGNCVDGIAAGVLSGASGLIQGNFIGTDITGGSAIPNGWWGIAFNGYNFTIGGTTSGAGNVVAFNYEGGVGVLFPNRSVRLLGNSIFSNIAGSLGGLFSLGIDIGEDQQTGGSNLPILTRARRHSSNTVTINGELNSLASTRYRIEFFANASCNPSGFGEGRKYLGFVNAKTDAKGNGSFQASLPATGPAGLITATATDSDGNTSEFSACRSMETSFFALPPCRVVDTRTAPGPLAGPALTAGTERSFEIGGQCGVPPTAEAVSVNVTVTQPTSPGDLKIYAGGGDTPVSAAISYGAGQTRANNAIVSLGPAGDITVHCDQASGNVQLIIDVNGYFQ